MLRFLTAELYVKLRWLVAALLITSQVYFVTIRSIFTQIDLQYPGVDMTVKKANIDHFHIELIKKIVNFLFSF